MLLTLDNKTERTKYSFFRWQSIVKLLNSMKAVTQSLIYFIMLHTQNDNINSI